MKATLEFTVHAKVTEEFHCDPKYLNTEEEEKQALIDTLKQYTGPNVDLTVIDFKLAKEA